MLRYIFAVIAASIIFALSTIGQTETLSSVSQCSVALCIPVGIAK